MNDCSICMCEYPDDQCYTLPNCLHKFCKTCLSSQFEQKIKDLQIDLSDFKCPLCNRTFSPDILEQFLPKPLYNKYCDFAFQFNKIMGLEDYEILTNCLNKNCQEKYIIWKDAGYATCPTCKMQFCRLCQLEYHQDKGITCEAWKEQHKDFEYLEMKRTLKICRCPKCRNACEKISGCNFMYCQCKATFCFLCDNPLEEKYHCSHFQKSDPYGSPCRVWQDGTWVDPIDVKPKVAGEEKVAEIKQVIVDNPIPCPNCGNLKNDISQLIVEDKYILCNSVKCKGLVYCLHCKKAEKLNDLWNHFAANGNNCKYQ